MREIGLCVATIFMMWLLLVALTIPPVVAFPIGFTFNIGVRLLFNNFR